MCLQSCFRAVITDWLVFVMLSFSPIKVDMKPQPVQISEPLCVFVSSAPSKHVAGAHELEFAS